MKFIPNYRVCYNGQFHEALKEFDIDSADAEEMKEHGKIVEQAKEGREDDLLEKPGQPDEVEESESMEETEEEQPKRGRPRK